MATEQQASRAVRAVLIGVVLVLAPMFGANLPAARAASLAPGDLDPSYGSGGVARHDLRHGPTFASRTYPLVDGRTLVASWIDRMDSPDGYGMRAAMRRFDRTGALDRGYGQDGVSLGTPITPHRLVVAPSGETTTLEIAWESLRSRIGRVTPRGDADPEFGEAGVVRLPERFLPAQVAVQPDRSVVVLGVRKVNGVSYADPSQSSILRYDAAGEPDPSWGDAGRVDVDLPTRPVGIAVDSVGRVVVTGHLGNRVRVARLTTIGQVDASFGTGGATEVALTAPADIHGHPVVSQRLDGADRVLVLAADRTVRLDEHGEIDPSYTSPRASSAVDGVLTDAAVDPAGGLVSVRQRSDEPNAYRVRHHLPDGPLDDRFGEGGEVVVTAVRPPGFESTSREGGASISLPSSGGQLERILVSAATWDERAAVHALTPDGRRDGSFAGGTLLLRTEGSTHDTPDRVLLDPAGGVLVSSTSSDEPTVTRFTDAGALDPTFGVGGVVRIPVSTTLSTWIDRQSDGKLVVLANTLERGLCVIRLSSAGSIDGTYGTGGRTCIDRIGEGFQVVALTDGRAAIVAGGAFNLPDYPLVVALTPDGRRDLSYGSGEAVEVPLVGATGAVAMPGGRLALAGRTAERGHLALLVLGANGTKDPGFGRQGMATTEQAWPPDVNTRLVRSNGQIYAFTATPTQRRGTLARFSSSGSLENAFTFDGGAKDVVEGREGDVFIVWDRSVTAVNAYGTAVRSFGPSGTGTLSPEMIVTGATIDRSGDLLVVGFTHLGYPLSSSTSQYLGESGTVGRVDDPSGAISLQPNSVGWPTSPIHGDRNHDLAGADVRLQRVLIRSREVSAPTVAAASRSAGGASGPAATATAIGPRSTSGALRTDAASAPVATTQAASGSVRTTAEPDGSSGGAPGGLAVGGGVAALVGGCALARRRWTPGTRTPADATP